MTRSYFGLLDSIRTGSLGLFYFLVEFCSLAAELTLLLVDNHERVCSQAEELREWGTVFATPFPFDIPGILLLCLPTIPAFRSPGQYRSPSFTGRL